MAQLRTFKTYNKSKKPEEPLNLLKPTAILTAICMCSTLAYAAIDFHAQPGRLDGPGIKSGKTSWFGQYGYGRYNNGKHTHVWRDTGDNGKNASGLPQTTPGIAIYDRKTLGHWYEVELKGKKYKVRQVDIGPAPWTGRKIDINAPLADMAGWSPKNFPTDSTVKYRYLGKNLPPLETLPGNVAEVDTKKLPKLAMLDMKPSLQYHAIVGTDLKEKEVEKKLDNTAPDKQERAKMLTAADRAPQLVGGYPWGLHPVIKDSMLHASKHLPIGYKFRFNNAGRNSSTVGSASYHVKRDKSGHALATDIEILDPKGRVLKNIRSPATFAMYRDFMHWTKKYQYDRHPAYRGKGRWGGYFVSGVSQDLMHYDLGPENETMAGSWEHGLKPRYAHFGRREDVGRGMGKIAAFRLPNPFEAVAGIPMAIAGLADRAVTAGHGHMEMVQEDRPRRKKKHARRASYYDHDDDWW